MPDPVIVPPAGDPPAPVAPPAGAPAPAPPAIDPVEHERLKAQLAQLSEHKTKIDREREKERAERSREKQERDAQRLLLVKAGLIPDDTADPAEQLRKREDAERATRDAATALEVGLSRAMFGKSLVPKDGDLDYVLYKIRKDKTLSDAASAGDFDDLLESLKAKGYVSTLTAPTPAAPAPDPKTRAAAPSPGAAPDPTFDKIQTFADLGRLGPMKMLDFQEKHPDRYRLLRAEHDATLSRPRQPAFPIGVGSTR